MPYGRNELYNQVAGCDLLVHNGCMSEQGRFAVSRWARWSLWLMLAGLLAAAAAWGFRLLTSGQSRLSHMADQAQVIGLYISAVGAMLQLAEWVRGRFSEAEGDPAEILADRVWDKEAASRWALLGGIQAANVAFSAGQRPSRDSRPQSIPALERFLRIAIRYRDEQSRLTGDLESIDRFWAQLPSRRLVILGEPGTGKTVLAIELILRLLDPNRASYGNRDFIPVRVSLAGWSVEHSLADWLVERIHLDYRIPPAVARRLIDGRSPRVLPVLDGLDEMDPDSGATGSAPPRRALAVLDKLNNYLDGAKLADVVVTCRTASYEQLQSYGAALHDASKIHVLPLDAEEIRAYIDARFARKPDQQAAWHQVLSTRDKSARQVWQAVLATPLRLMLATTLSDAGDAPTTLFAAIAGEESEARTARIKQHLLSGYVAAATRLAIDQPLRRRDRGRDGRRYNAERVTIWLRQLALHLSWQADHALQSGRSPLGLSGIDIVPHLLWPIGGRLRTRTLHILLSFLVAATGLTVAVWTGIAPLEFGALNFGQEPASVNDTPLPARALLLALFGIVVASVLVALRCSEPWPAPIIGTGAARLADALPIGLASGLMVGLLVGLAVETEAAVPAGIAAGLVAGRGSQRRWTQDADLDSPLGPLWDDAVRGILIGVVGGLVGGIASISAGQLPFGLEVWLLGGFAAACLIGLLVAFVGRLASGVWGRFSLDELSGWLASGFAVGLMGALEVKFVGWLAFGFAFGLTQSCVTFGRYFIGLFLAASQGKLPWRLGRFLKWAHEAGILRISGPAYQFRHFELQRWLIEVNSKV